MRILPVHQLKRAAAIACLVTLAQPLPAQQAASSPADTPRVSVSGIVFANYQYQFRPGGSANRFDLERAYLTARGALGRRTSFRVTTDVFQQTRDTVNRSWQVRAKYAYLQYDYLRSAWARLGLLQTVFIEHDESFWPRWISTTPTDRHGFFSSADAGIATNITLPAEFGEIYATVTNGPGFGSREIDRFKDYAARLTLAPFAHTSLGAIRPLTFSLWGYRGALASRFVQGGAGQIGPVGSSLRRDRWGVFAALNHAALTFAAQHARRIEEGELGSNTTLDPRQVVDSTGSVTAVYGIARPFSASAALRPLSLVARWDHVTPNRATGSAHDLAIAGVIWDLSSRVAISLDFQGQYPDETSQAPETRTLFLHGVARF
jgi:hypothetical protein